MRILFLTRSFNSLAQRLYLDLTAMGHEVAVELDIADSVTEEAVALFQPALVVAPFLKRAIPESVWRHTPCLVVHPGIVGDRGPSALDWAIARGASEWGVTVLQAQAEMDAGQYDPAIEGLKALSTQTAGMPVDGVLMELARAYRGAGKVDDARKTLNEIVEKHAESPFAAEARAELDKLKG